jgi:hypothetical protein
MVQRPLRRALVLAVVSVMAFAGAAAADNLRADGDAVTPGAQTFVDLGEVAPSAVISVPVAFELVCTSSTHPDAGQTITLTWSAQSAPAGGAVLSATGATVGPVPAGWTVDLASCPSPAPILAGATTSTVTLRAPSIPNVGYVYTVGWTRSIAPVGVDDSHALSGTFTAISFTLDVVANAAPVVTVPGDQVVEGDTVGGWTAVYPGVSATDAEDDPDPTPVCSPAAGEVLPLGTTTVSCTATDTGGKTATADFDVTVVDTTAPSLTVASDQQVTTDDPNGTTLSYDPPAVADVVDPNPDVVCDPLDGAAIPVGTTTVMCSATDASANAASASFDVVVEYVPVHTASVEWLEPLGIGTSTFEANRGRTIPIKATLSIDGVVVETGHAVLSVTPCEGGSPVELALERGGGRWNASLDTTALVGSCHTVTASVDGLVAGSFTLDLRGAEAAKANPPRTR